MRYGLGPYIDSEEFGPGTKLVPDEAVGSLGFDGLLFVAVPDALALPADYESFGQGHISELSERLSIFDDMVGRGTLQGATLLDRVWYALTVAGGETCLMPTGRGDLNLHLGGHSIIRTKRFSLAMPEAQPVVARLKAQYRAHRTNALAGEMGQTVDGVFVPDPQMHCRVLDFWGEKYRVSNPEDLFVPADIPKEARLQHRTVLSDNFDRADQSLDATGAWTEVVGNADIASNQVANVSGTNHNRFESDLSSDDHWSEIDVILNGNTNSNNEAYARFNPSAETFYRGISRNSSTNTYRLFRHITGTSTQIGSTVNATPLATTHPIRCTANGSDITLTVDGVDRVTASDANISGFVRAGFGHSNTPTATFDDWHSEDLAVVAGVPVGSLMMMGVGR